MRELNYNLYLVFYHIFLILFNVAMQLAALFHPKAKAWVNGRKGIWQKLANAIDKKDKVIWMHVASLGEFEQGRPLLEKLKSTYPTYKLLLTFFSPSGYEVRKNYKGADWVFYLPMDGPKNAKRFLDIAHPSLVIFVKYEFWFFYLKKISYKKIPLLLVAALFRKEMSFFKWYGSISRKMLARFDHLFVQNASSFQLLQQLGLEQIVSISGDTRFDRVIENAVTPTPIEIIKKFKGDSPLLIAGSTWPGDEKVIQQAILDPSLNQLKLVIAPHEINTAHLEQLQLLFPEAVLFSSSHIHSNNRILLIDSIGQLATCYQYADFALIGGGFKQPGIHNTLEAAVYGIPIFFGPNYEKFAEAIELVKVGAAFSLKNTQDAGKQLAEQLQYFLANNPAKVEAGDAARRYVLSQKGATEKILKFIANKRYLS